MKKKHDLRIYPYPILKKLIMKIKIAFVIMVLGVTNILATSSYSQAARVSLDFESKTLELVMDDIERQSEFYFVFNQKQIDVSRVIDIQVEKSLITEVLPKLFNGTNVNYAIIDRKILLTTDPIENHLLGMSSVSSGRELQQQKITGTVIDGITGEPIPGVNIQIQGTLQGAITDVDGKYSLAVPDPAATLIFSYVGYVTKSIAIAGQSVIDVNLAVDIKALDEVVVVGYGTQTKRNLASAVSSLGSEDLTNISTTDARQTLQGKIAGVQVTNNSGVPGSGAKIIIRGMGSFSSVEPLYVIDGIQGGDLNSINSADIESITVLKDASTTAIYGAAAANGVVVITTKSGRKGAKTNITYSGSFGIANVPKHLDLMNSEQYVEFVTDIQENSGLGITDKLRSADVLVDRTDWQDVLFKQGRNTEHTLRIDGGGEAISYSLSAGYLKEGSTTIDVNLERVTLGTKLTEKVFNNKLRLNQSIRLKRDVTDGTTPNSVENSTSMRKLSGLHLILLHMIPKIWADMPEWIN